jgi:hypothetical protein
MPSVADAPPPTNAHRAEDGALGDPNEWSLTCVGRTRRLEYATRSTIRPVWVPGDPPVLLVAGRGGELVAFDARDGSGAVRNLIWTDLRRGLIDLRGLTRSTRVLIWLGFVLLVAMLGALLFNDLWRAHSPLLATATGVPGRGTLVPVALVPSSLFMLVVAWSLALSGALHCAIFAVTLAAAPDDGSEDVALLEHEAG